MSKSYRTILSTLNNQEPFILLVKTDNAGTSNNDQFTIPTTGTGYNYKVKTSDGYTASGLTGNHTITFPSGAGEHLVYITGDFPKIYFNNGGDRRKALDVQKWGDIVWASDLTSSYYGCTNLQVTATDNPNLSNVTSLALFFRGCTALNSLSIANWDVSNVQTFSQMFRSASNFNQNIGGWNVSNAVLMTKMFEDATAFNQNIGGWNVSGVTNISEMFRSASNFNQNIGSWNVGSVTNMRAMFFNATAFNQNIGGWNVSSVENFGQMFRGATAFNQNIGGWNVSSGTNFSDFMQVKTNLNYSAANLDAIYNGWSLLSLQPNLSINFNTIKHTSAGSAGRAVLVGAPNNWTITDGGI